MHKYDVDGELQPEFDIARLVLANIVLVLSFLFGYILGGIEWAELSLARYLGYGIMTAISAGGLIFLYWTVLDDMFWRRG